MGAALTARLMVPLDGENALFLQYDYLEYAHRPEGGTPYPYIF